MYGESKVCPLSEGSRLFPLGGRLTKTSAPEPHAGRFPKFLLPRAAGRPQKFKPTKAIQSPMLVRVIGREWNSGVPGGSLTFPGLPMAAGTHPGLTIGGRGAAKIVLGLYMA